MLKKRLGKRNLEFFFIFLYFIFMEKSLRHGNVKQKYERQNLILIGGILCFMIFYVSFFLMLFLCFFCSIPQCEKQVEVYLLEQNIQQTNCWINAFCRIQHRNIILCLYMETYKVSRHFSEVNLLFNAKLQWNCWNAISKWSHIPRNNDLQKQCLKQQKSAQLISSSFDHFAKYVMCS